MQPTRLIMFLELVRGCNNTECPSYGTVCKYGEQKYITENTINDIGKEFRTCLNKENPFEVIDIWAYGCGDSLDHPDLETMLKTVRNNFGDVGKISMAIDSRRTVPKQNNWVKYMDKIKIIHKIPESFDWIDRAKMWSQLPIQMSHKLITNHISTSLWNQYKNNPFITELKIVPWHDIELGTNNPTFTQRKSFTYDDSVPVILGEYTGRPVRRIMTCYDGSLRRCLVSPTNHQSLNDLILGADNVCRECFPLTGGQLAKFYDDHVKITNAVNCVSDGYFVPTSP
jgi:hypothetical protein